MGFFSKIADVATGGLAKEVFDAVKDYFPPDVTPEKKAEFALKAQEIEAARAKDAALASLEAEQKFNERLKEHEGTAGDLKSMPILGPIMLFLRGAQRPVWGFSTLYFDFLWFTKWDSLSNEQEAALYIINFLVLGFLFGERALINVAPLLREVFNKPVGK